MELKKISENDIEQVSQLYYSAFPEDESCLLYTSRCV